MLERIGHIKNPLTVIAMFAAIAEVSGTIVLPLISESVQEIYVWFLMVFPCLLVFLFFVTLWTNHTVLYAPSDYRDEAGFVSLFKYAPQGDDQRGRDAVVENFNASSESGLQFSVPDISSDNSSSESMQDLQQSVEIQISPSETVVKSVIEASGAVKDSFEAFTITKNEYFDQYRRSGLFRHDAAKLLAAREGASFSLLASPKTMKDVVFDVIFNSDKLNGVGKIVYVTSASRIMVMSLVRSWFRTVLEFKNTLSEDELGRFECIVVFVSRNLTPVGLKQLENECQKAAKDYPFKVRCVHFNAEKLVVDIKALTTR